MAYKRPRLDKTCGGVFGGVFALETFVNQKWAPGKLLVLKLTIISQFPDSEKKSSVSTTLWRVVGVVPGGAHKSTGGWCEGSNPPQGMPGDHSCENVLAVWPGGPIAQWNMLAQHLHANGTRQTRISKYLTVLFDASLWVTTRYLRKKVHFSFGKSEWW